MKIYPTTRIISLLKIEEKPYIDFIIRESIHHNMVVYDDKDRIGKFTKRLVVLMKTVMRRTYNDEIIKFISSTRPDYSTIEFKEMNGLKLLQLFYKHKGTLPANKYDLIIAVGKKSALLGCY